MAPALPNIIEDLVTLYRKHVSSRLQWQPNKQKPKLNATFSSFLSHFPISFCVFLKEEKSGIWDCDSLLCSGNMRPRHTYLMTGAYLTGHKKQGKNAMSATWEFSHFSCNFVRLAIRFIDAKKTPHADNELSIEASYASTSSINSPYWEPMRTIE